MESGYHIEELISKYLADQTDAVEEMIVLKWIEASEANRKHFENLRNVWLLSSLKTEFDKIDPEYEWSVFKKVLNNRESLGKLDYSSETSATVSNEKHTRKTPVYKLIIAVAIAASLIIIIWQEYIFKEDIKQSTGSTTVAKITEKPGKESVVHRKRNVSGRIEEITLGDGSTVLLYDKSEINYNEPFSNLRELVISGKAEFKVAKDSTKPFTVFSSDLSTTALGTDFSVENFEGSKNIIIKLYEGKVLVKSVDAARRKLDRNYYLLPGDELVYTRENATAFVKKTRANAFKPFDTSYAREVPLFPRNEKGSWYMFNNESLPNVFNQLQDMYNVRIEYSEKDVSNMYFIGKFGKSLSVDSVLKEITTLNDLQLIKVNNGFKILSKR